MVKAVAKAEGVTPPPANAEDTDQEKAKASLAERAGFLYRLNITTAALLVSVIWLVHLSVLGSLGAVLIYHLFFHLGWFADYGLLALLLYTLPALLGSVLLAVLVKPLIPLRRRPAPELSLQPERQQRLHAFITQVCRRVGAPVPRSIIVTAGAELGTDFGYVPEIPARAPSLRLGLTLVNGVTAGQLAGLIARELGYLGRAQAAQRTQFVRATHERLRQACFEPDRLDHLLEHLEEGPTHLALLSRGAARLLGLSRYAHRGLLRMVHSVGSGPLTLLEYRLDRLQAILTGSETFRATLAKQRLLEVAFETATGEQERRWYEEGALAERLPTATLALARAGSGDFQREVQEIMRASDTGTYRLRPPDVKRIESIEKAALSARLPDGRPARELVAGFDRLSRRTTYLHYRNAMGLAVTADRLIAAAQPGKAEMLLERYFLGLHQIPVTLNLPLPSANSGDLRGQIRAVAQQIKSAQAAVGAAVKKYVEIDHRLSEANAHEALAGAKLPVPDDQTDLESIQQECRRLENEEDNSLSKLQEAIRLPAQRLGIGLAALGTAAANPAHQEIERLRSALRRTDEVTTKLRALRTQTIIMELLLSHRPARNQALADRIEEQATDLRQLLLAIRLSLREAPWPFGQTGPKDNLARHIIGGKFREADPDELLDIAAAALSRIQAVRKQILARLVQLAMAGEKRLVAGG